MGVAECVDGGGGGSLGALAGLGIAPTPGDAELGGLLAGSGALRSVETCCAASMSGGGTLPASVVWETVVRPAAHGSRKVGGNGSLESSSARFRFRDNMVWFGGAIDVFSLDLVQAQSSRRSDFPTLAT